MKLLRNLWSYLYERFRQKQWASGIIAKVSKGLSWYFRTFQGKSQNRIAGNSVASQLLILNARLPDCENYGIPGDESVGLELRFADIISGAKRVAIDIGGNDLHSGTPILEITQRIFRMAERAFSSGCLFAWIEPPALGTQHREWNEQVAKLIKSVEAMNLQRVTKGLRSIRIIRVRLAMSGPDGYIKPAFYGDGIHPNGLCIGEVYFHELNSFFQEEV